MKKIITSALVVMATATGFAQEVKQDVKGELNSTVKFTRTNKNVITTPHRRTSIKWGIKGGLNVSTVEFTDTDQNVITIPDHRTSIYAGALVEFPLADKLYGQVEALYVSNGAKEINNQIMISQINVPFMVKYNVVNGLNVIGGGYLGGVLSIKNKIGNRISKQDAEDRNFLDGGVILGAEYNLPSNGLFFDARYNLGLANLSKVEDAIVKNRGFQIGLGYKF